LSEVNLQNNQTMSGTLTSSTLESIKSNYQRTLDRIFNAAQKAGRNPNQVRLVVVTKTHPVEVVEAAVLAGAAHIGESYADEAISKIAQLAGKSITWHMIGHVQSRKAAAVSTNFDYLHSLDSLKLAKRLNHFCKEAGRTLPFLFECNVSGETTKTGFSAWEERRWQALLPVFDEILTLEHLKCQGLMTIAPFFDKPEETRPYFRKLRALRDFLDKQFRSVCFDELSMGMSGDFEAAIQEGATWVRIGTAILGERLSRKG